MSGYSSAMTSYKARFVALRWLQTWLGGFQVVLKGEVAVSVHVVRTVLFVLPGLLAAAFAVVAAVLDDEEVTLALAVVAAGVQGLLTMALFLVAAKVEASFAARPPTAASSVAAMLFDDEDIVEYLSLSEKPVLDFLLPAKPDGMQRRSRPALAHAVLRALTSGAVAGLGVAALAPQVHEGGGWAVLALSSISIFLSLPTITAGKPGPEVASVRSFDKWGSDCFHRAAYCLLMLILTVASSSPVPRYLLCALWVLFPLGLLPHPFVFVLWFAEQAHVFLLGGSACLSDRQLVLELGVSGFTGIAVGVVVFFLDNPFVLAFVAIFLGGFVAHLLSRDPFKHLPKHILARTGTDDGVGPRETPLRPLTGPSATDPIAKVARSLFGKCHPVLQDVVAACCFAVLGLGLFLIGFALRSEGEPYSTNWAPVWLAILTLFVVALQYLTVQARRPFVMLALLRNPARSELTAAEWALLYYWSSRLSVVLAISSVCLTVGMLFDSILSLWASSLAFGVLLFRGLRWISQSPFGPAECAIALLLSASGRSFFGSFILPFLAADINVLAAGNAANFILLDFFFVTFCHSRLRDFFGMLFFAVVSIVKSMLEKKLRYSFGMLFGILSLTVELPVVIATVALAALLSAPLVPLFGLPLFIVGAPRPKKFWPDALMVSREQSAVPTTNDAAIYTHMTQQLRAKFHSLLTSGALGLCNTGSTFLLRHESRIAMIQITSRGFECATIVVRGLELQETSCHHTEAASIDDHLTYSGVMLEEESDSGIDPASGCAINRFAVRGHQLEPLGSIADVDAYSRSRSVLTGVLDHPDTLAKLSERFLDTILFALARVGAEKELFPAKVNMLIGPGLFRGAIDAVLRGDGKGGSSSEEKRERSYLGGAILESDDDTCVSEIDYAAAVKRSKLAGETSIASDSAWHRQWMAQLKKKYSRPGSDDEDKDYWNNIQILARECHKAVEVTALGGLQPQFAGVKHVLEAFGGGLTRATSADGKDTFFADRDALARLTLWSYRVATKIAIDELVICPNDDAEELDDSLAEIAEEWLVALETDEVWVDAISTGSADRLFALSRELGSNVETADGAPVALQLTLNTGETKGAPRQHFSSLSPQTVNGLWAGLTIDLLYVTNDDDERYGVQAHESLLRNICLQAADPPLGYPMLIKSFDS